MGHTGNSWEQSLTVTTDFDRFVKDNMSDPKFKEFGKVNKMEGVRELWRKLRVQQEIDNANPMSVNEAMAVINNTPEQSLWRSWLVDENVLAKEPLLDRNILGTPNVLNAGWNIAYSHYVQQTSNPLSFREWLFTPTTLYRGTHLSSDSNKSVFMAYSPDKSVAQHFAGKGGTVHSIKIRPVDTYGSYNTNGEQEVFVPRGRYR